MATLTEQTSDLAANFYSEPSSWTTKKKAGLNVALLILTGLSHCFGVRVCHNVSFLIASFC